MGDYYLETDKYSRARKRIQDLGVYLGYRRDKTLCPNIDQQLLDPIDRIAPRFANS